jgi:hypothetical protein
MAISVRLVFHRGSPTMSSGARWPLKDADHPQESRMASNPTSSPCSASLFEIARTSAGPRSSVAAKGGYLLEQLM